MIVITSAEYIKQDLQVEFGILPPSMLPLGNKRLYEFQVEKLREAFTDEIIISLPFNYNVSEQDVKKFEELKVEIVFVPEGISLAESLLYVLNTRGSYQETVKILHGDTLIEQLPKNDDLIGISPTHYEYDWEFENKNYNKNKKENLVWCGFFSFSNAPLFIKSLSLARSNFVQAVRSYDSEIQLSKEIVKSWYDFGHSNTYYKSRSIKTTEREFNSLSITNGYVYKSGSKIDKISAESNWFQNIPWKIKRFTPQLLDYGWDSNSKQSYYMLEYVMANPLNELYVYGENSLAFWDQIFNHTGNFLNVCEEELDEQSRIMKHNEIKNETNILLEEKTYSRIEEYSKTTGFDLKKEMVINGKKYPSLLKVAEICINLSKETPIVPGIMHGDLCFSNILYDSRADQIKVLDPRGMNNNSEKTIYGDLRYDLAKLSHSVIGLYDYIIAGVMEFKVNNSYNMDLEFFSKGRINEIQSIFLNKNFFKNSIEINSILPITILLFISMLPLHSDNELRQKALLSNAFRLFDIYQGGKYDSNTNGGKKLSIF